MLSPHCCVGSKRGDRLKSSANEHTYCYLTLLCLGGSECVCSSSKVPLKCWFAKGLATSFLQAPHCSLLSAWNFTRVRASASFFSPSLSAPLRRSFVAASRQAAAHSSSAAADWQLHAMCSAADGSCILSSTIAAAQSSARAAASGQDLADPLVASAHPATTDERQQARWK